MNLTPIETIYNGYRFRSRLEARWAVFFDQCKIKYSYEQEGYVLPSGEWYLPDFWLPEIGMFVEIKPRDAFEPWNIPTIYFAGKMDGAFRRRKGEVIHRGKSSFVYAGPTEVKHYDLGDVVKRDLEDIDDCDIFFALLDRMDLYGTLAEIGYAHGRGKRIVIGVAAEIHPIRACREGVTPCCMAENGCGEIYRTEDSLDDLWFARKFAEIEHVSSSEEEALAKFFDCVDKAFPRPDIYQKCAEMARAKANVMCCFGDPVECRWHVLGSHNRLPNEHPANKHPIGAYGFREKPTYLSCLMGPNSKEAVFARQARFEHGETPKPADKGNTGNVATISLKGPKIADVFISSRHNKAHELEAMAAVINALCAEYREAIASIFCDSNACALYEIELRRWDAAFAEVLGAKLDDLFLRHGGGGHNGIFITAAGNPDPHIVDPNWQCDRDSSNLSPDANRGD